MKSGAAVDPVGDALCMVTPDEFLVKKAVCVVLCECCHLIAILNTFVTGEQLILTEYGESGLIARVILSFRDEHADVVEIHSQDD